VDTGCVELLGETYFHSLAFLYDTQRVFGSGNDAPRSYATGIWILYHNIPQY
jgi:hypothetical protein